MELILQLVGLALGLTIVSKYVVKLRNLVKEAAEVLIAVDKMVEDNKITLAEITNIKNESIDVWVAIKAFGKK